MIGATHQGFRALGGTVFWLAMQSAVSAGFTPTGAGPFDFNDTANWQGATIDGLMAQVLTANQVVELSADYTLNASLLLNFGGNFDLTLRGDNANRVLTLNNANLRMQTAAGRTATIGSGADGQRLRLLLTASSEISTNAGNTLVIMDRLSASVTDVDLVKEGDGTLILRASNTWTGRTDVRKGLVKLGTLNALPITTDLLIQNGGMVDMNDYDQTVGGLSSDGEITNNGAAVSKLTFDSTGGTTFSGKITKNIELVKKGTGSLLLTGANTYAGNTTIEAGKLTLGDTNSLPSTTRLKVDAGAELDLQASNIKVAGLTGGGTIRTSLVDPMAPYTVTVQNGAGDNDTFAGVMKTDIRLEKKGAGKLTLTGKNLYDGGTVVDGGTLIVNTPGPDSGTGSGAVEVKAGRLDGAGHIDGNVTIRAGAKQGNKLDIKGKVTNENDGKVGVGETPGKLQIAGGLDMAAGGEYDWQITSNTDQTTGVPGVDFSQVALTGGELVLGPASSLRLEFIGAATSPDSMDPFWQVSHSWKIMDLSGAASIPGGAASFGAILTSSSTGAFSTSVGSGSDLNDLFLQYTPVPGPGPACTLLLVPPIAACSRRRRA